MPSRSTNEYRFADTSFLSHVVLRLPYVLRDSACPAPSGHAAIDGYFVVAEAVFEYPELVPPFLALTR